MDNEVIVTAEILTVDEIQFTSQKTGEQVKYESVVCKIGKELMKLTTSDFSCKEYVGETLDLKIRLTAYNLNPKIKIVGVGSED